MLFDDPEAPTTITQPFDYGTAHRRSGHRLGRRSTRARSCRSTRRRRPRRAAAAADRRRRRPRSRRPRSRRADPRRDHARRPADATRPPARCRPSRRRTSSIVDPTRSATRQHARGDGSAARLLLPGDRRADPPQRARASRRRASRVPGAAMYLLIGRTHDYAWSLTSANHDVRDVFAEQLCNPDGSRADAGVGPLRVPGRVPAVRDVRRGHAQRHADRATRASVHGPVIGTATSQRPAGRAHPAALDVRSRRPEPRRAEGHDRGQGDDAATSSSRPRTSSASRSTGATRRAARPRTSRPGSCRVRAPGLDRRLPTRRHRRVRVARLPQRVAAPAQRSGTERPAAELEQPVGTRASCTVTTTPFGSVHRVELFDKFPARVTLAERRQRHEPRRDRGRALAGVAGREPGAARRPRAEPARRAGGRRARRLGAPRRARCSTPTTAASTTTPGPTIMNALWNPIATAVMQPGVRRPHRRPRRHPRPRQPLGRVVRRQGPAHAARTSRCKGRFHLSYCGKGSLAACRASLWAAIDQVAAQLAATAGPGPGRVAQRARSAPGSRPG